jgi:ATP-dependent DNA helicase RecG
LERQSPRNRRLAEAFSRCGLVERAGQGVNRMFEECIKESKPRPDFTGTDDYQVSLTLHGSVQDPLFLRFLEQIGREKLALYSTQDLLILDWLHREEQVPSSLRPRLSALVEQGVVERVSRGRGTRYILSRALYGYLGKKGMYTARRGLDRDTNKQLLLKHIRDNRKVGSPLSELRQVLPSLSLSQVQTLVRELQAEGLVHCVGRTKAAKWYPGSTMTPNT